MMNAPFLSVALAAPLLFAPAPPVAALAAPPSGAPLLGAPVTWELVPRHGGVAFVVRF